VFGGGEGSVSKTKKPVEKVANKPTDGLEPGSKQPRIGLWAPKTGAARGTKEFSTSSKVF